MQKIKLILKTNKLLKISSLLAATLFWYLFSGIGTTTLSVRAPLYFYNVKNEKISAPEYIQLTLQAKREYLYHLDPDELAVHINGDLLQQGKQLISITNKELFLPDSIKLVHYNPIVIQVT